MTVARVSEPEQPTPEIPVLSDGVRLDSLIDRENRRVNARVFVDPEIYRLEQQRIFARTWNALGHVSEIPEPGDFVVRRIGEDSVIVVRGEDGDISVMLNACSHRGMALCRVEAGAAKRFVCPYHGWAYDRRGRLVGVAHEARMYPDGLDRKPLGLVRARVEVCGGIVFANWDPEAPALEDYLGPFAGYLRRSFDRTSGGLVAAGPPERWALPANWKFAADQLAGDAYHATVLHRSVFEFYPTAVRPGERLEGVNIASRSGHHVRIAPLPEAVSEGTGYLDALAGLPPSLYADATGHMSEADLKWARRAAPRTGSLMPNLHWLCTVIPMADGSPGPGVLTFRILLPRGIDGMEQMVWAFYERDADPDYQDETVRNLVQTFGMSGIWDQDDSEAWVAMQAALRGHVTANRWLDYRSASPAPTDEFPGLTLRGPARDDCQWLAWERYFDLMCGNPVTAEEHGRA